MASSSSSSTLIQKHDVFLSFRGEDTRYNFTSHLYAALCHKKIGTYIDYELDKGDEISQALVKATRESKISVFIFSENYASSTGCLDELVHILSCKEENGQIVIPVFYRVDPSNVRKQQGSYETALAALEERLAAAGIEKLRRWRRALATAASLSGWDSSVTKPESELVEEIVKDVFKKLEPTLIQREIECRGLVGIPKRIEKIESILSIGSPENFCICISGPKGIGKTTLARIVFNKISPEFEGSSFVENVEEKLQKLGNERFKKEVFSTLLDEKASKMLSCCGELFSYEARLRYTRVLIVLDDLNHLVHFRLFVGGDVQFGPGSRIIVTSRDKSLIDYAVDDHRIYDVERLNHDESLLLFNSEFHKRSSSESKWPDLPTKTVEYIMKSCEGNPDHLKWQVEGFYTGCTIM